MPDHGNLPTPLPAGADIFENTYSFGPQNSSLDLEVLPLFYTETDLVLCRADIFAAGTTSIATDALTFAIGYKTVARGTAVASPNDTATYTDLASVAVSGGPAAVPGTIHSMLDEDDDAVLIPAGSLVVLESDVAGSTYPLEVLYGGMVRLAGYRGP